MSGCVSHDCKLDLVSDINALRYQREILQASVVPHFDNHVLADRPIFMGDNARPRRLVLTPKRCGDNSLASQKS